MDSYLFQTTSHHTGQMDSFFDVWTEISFDGGETWQAADGGTSIMHRR